MTLANRVTIARILLIPVFVVLMYMDFEGSGFWAAFVFALAASTDFLDGYLARSRNEITTFGKFMDPIADKLMLMTAYIILVGLGRMHALFCVVFVGREFIISGFRLVKAAQGTVIAADILGKIKTIVQIVSVVVLMLGNWPFSLIGLPFDQFLLWLALLLTVWSMFEYIWKNRQGISLAKDGVDV